MDFQDVYNRLEEDFRDLAISALEDLNNGDFSYSSARGNHLFDYLATKEFVKVKERGYTAHEDQRVYSITEQGRNFLAWLVQRV